MERLAKPIRVRSMNAPPMNAPRAAREAAALRYARSWLSQTQGQTGAQTSTFNWRFWTKLSVVREIVHTAEGHRSAVTSRWNENALVKLIADARAGDADSRAVLRDLSRELIDREEPPIGPLKDYLIEDALADSPPKAKRETTNAHSNAARDADIANLVERLQRLFNLLPTRNPAIIDSLAPETQSACSIVAQAAQKQGIQNASGKLMTEHDVVGILRKRLRQLPR
jgi:hypothetical protein